MTPGLFLVSRDSKLANQLGSRVDGRIELVVADGPEAVQQQHSGITARAVLAHLDQATLNGYSADQFIGKLRKIFSRAPIYGLVDRRYPTEFKQPAADTMQTCISLPLESGDIEQWIDRWTSPGLDVGSYDTGLPHRIFQGQTRSLITFTPSMFETLDQLKVAATHDVTILLVGETGSGKTYLARLIHELSACSSQRCLTVSCGALPADLIESELFGYVKGAFTGADSDKPGKFAAAANGTLLLDEIDVLAPRQQTKLLRVIETGEYEPVGSNETQVSTARLIVASNHDLDMLVKTNQFRLDLYYRLNMLSFRLPPLRERSWDIEYLARKFALDHSRSHHIELKHIEPEFLSALRRHHWPGNIRELENVIRRAVLYCRDNVLTQADLPGALRSDEPTTRGASANGQSRTLEHQLEEVERQIIEDGLRRHKNHRTATAKELGISRVTLYNKMKKFGMLK